MINKLNTSLKNLYKNMKYRASSISSNIFTDKDYMKNAMTFVNSKDFPSTTSYFIWVDTKNYKTNIFEGSKNNWKIKYSYLCSVGKYFAPTIKGNFTVGEKGPYFGVNRGYKCLYYTQIKGNYLFHSIIYNLDGSIRDSRLGMNLTDGCVRLATENAKWIYDNIPMNTAIYIS